MLPLIALSIVSQAAAPKPDINVRDFGAKGDGKTLDTAAINRAISTCARQGGGKVLVPAGHYLTGTVMLQSHVTLEILSGAILLASDNPEDYPLEPDGFDPKRLIRSPLINARDAENITLTGRGMIDGCGAIWWKRLELADPRYVKGRTLSETEKSEAAKVAQGRPHLIRPVRCKDVVIEQLHLKDSPEWNVHPMFCEDVRIEGLRIDAAEGSHNTDGINPESCRNVHISNCRINTGDDCITLKSGLNELGRKMGRPDENITIQNCILLRGHGAVTIGSEMSGGVRNITVSNCVFQGTDIGIRIKSQRGRGGVVEGLVVSNIVMHDVAHPFNITTFYMGKDKPTDVFAVTEETPTFRNFHFSNITARGGKDCGSITGLKELPVSNITFLNVQLEAEAGFSCTNVRDIRFISCRLQPKTGAALLLKNAAEIDAPRLTREEKE